MTFKNNSHECKLAIKKAQLKWLEAACLIIESAAKPLIPVETSALKTSLGHKINIETLECYVGVGTDYAIYVEFGTGEFAENGNGRKGGWCYVDEKGVKHFTKGQRPKPYLRPAYINNKKEIVKLLEKYLREIR